MANKQSMTKIPIGTLNPEIQAAPNMEYEVKPIPLNGKWSPASNPALLGTNFKTLTNMRYVEGHPESIMGMTKINTTALTTYVKPKNAYYFSKTLYSDSHLYVQVYNSGGTASVIKDNITAIPGAGNYLERIDLNVAPSTAWQSGTSMSGTAVTFTIERVLNAFSYVIKNRVGSFVAADTLTDGTTAAIQTGLYPILTDYSVFTETTLDMGMFSGSPNGEVIYCNGVDNCICDGDESRVPAFITAGAVLSAATDAITGPMDVTSVLSRKLNISENIVLVGEGTGGANVYASFNGTAGESPHTIETGQALTSTGGAALSTADKKFGTGSYYGDGDGCYGTIAKESCADWALGNSFTISFYGNLIRTASRDYYFVGQYKGANDYWHLTAHRTYAVFFTVDEWTFSAKSTGGVLVNYKWTKVYAFDGSGWRHYALVRSGSSLKLFIDGKQVTMVTETNPISNQTIPVIDGADGALYIAGQPTVGKYLYGYMDDFSISKSLALYSVNFTPPSSSVATAAKTFLIGTTRPATSVHFYLSVPNVKTSTTMSGKYYNSSGWHDMDIIDHTVLNTATLGQSGKVTWETPVDEERKYLEGYYLYWYQLTITGGSASLYHVTCHMPFQNIQDVWDGNFTEIAACFKQSDGAISDQTLNVMNIDDYLTDDAASYLGMNLFDESDEVFMAFTHQITGLYIDIPESQGNVVDSDILLYYWTGAAWMLCSNIVDGTSTGDATLANTGVVTWSAPPSNTDVKRSMYGSFPLYFYKLMVIVDGAGTEITNGVRINYISGIPTPNVIKGYSFGIHAADRLMLGCDNYGNRNQLWVSAQDRPEVLNGSDSQKILFGGNGALTCGAAVFAQYASNIYNIILIYKATETWIMQWNQSSSGTSWSRFCISPNVGCPAPRTLCTASVVFENNINQVKNVAIWRAQDGIYISNGQSPFKVSKDIDNVFDRYAATHVNMAMVKYEYSFVDEEKMEYHWLWASGTSTTLDKEYVLDLQEWKWYEVSRGTNNQLQCGVVVNDTDGNKYTYGFIDSGYTERLEYGAKMDAANLVSTMEFGEIVPSDSVVMFSTLAMVNLICVPKATDSSVVMTHYLDGLHSSGTPSGTDYTFTISDSTHSYANVMKDVFSKPAIFHRTKFVHTATAETKGFEPLYLNIYSQKVRLHTR